jgi:hypothetical protein
MAWRPANTIKVSEVLDLFPHLGIPHFQRGRVWNASAIGALLESLFHETPCGSFVFWRSPDNESFGIPLAADRSEGIEYLVVDGQQRIRSLYDAFHDARLSADDDAAVDPTQSDEGGTKLWCVNLAKAPGFGEAVKSRVRNFPLFVYCADPAIAKVTSPLRDNVLPLREILGTPTWEDLSQYRDRIVWRAGAPSEGDEAKASGLYQDLRRGVLAIKDREFFVAIRESHSMAPMADLYNRINAGGKLVETEERAFAALVGMQREGHSVSDGLRGVFESVHPEKKPSRQDDLGRHDELIKREEERAFGFKLFLRVFLQVCQHHFGYRQPKTDFSFDLVGQEKFRDRFARLKPEEVGWLWAEAGRVLKLVKEGLLAEQLKCDDLRMLPDATSLMPLNQLLIQFRELEEAKYRSLLAGLCLRLVLGEFNSREIFRWVSAVADPNGHAFEVVPGVQKEVSRRVSEGLRSGLEDANSIQHRHVLILYWLQRHLGARDFLYSAVANPKKDLQPPEPALCRDVEPEKQHLVPFSNADAIFGERPRRTESHAFNSIGNLTYISSQLNGLTALGDDFADLDEEQRAAPQNLAAHLLVGPEHQEPLKHYLWLRERLQSAPAVPDSAQGLDEVESKFNAFVSSRRRLIQGALEGWLRQLDTDAAQGLKLPSLAALTDAVSSLPRIEPTLPRFPIDTHDAHIVRGLGFSDAAEDRLLQVVRTARRSKSLKGETGLSLQLTKNKNVWLELRPQQAMLCLSERLRGDLRGELLRTIGMEACGPSGVKLEPVPDLQPLIAFCGMKEREIEAAVRAAEDTRAEPPGGALPSLEHLGYSEAVIRLVLALGGQSVTPKAKSALSREVRERDGRQVLRIDLYPEGKQLQVRVSPEVGARLKTRFPHLTPRESKSRSLCMVSTEQDMNAVLSWIGSERLRAASHVADLGGPSRS